MMSGRNGRSIADALRMLRLTSIAQVKRGPHRVHPTSIGKPVGPLSRLPRRPRSCLHSHLRAGLVPKAEHWLRVPRSRPPERTSLAARVSTKLGIPVLV
jgi:hypothetical protein